MRGGLATEALIFFIKWAIETIGKEQETLRPWRRLVHLLAENLSGHPRIGFDYDFIVDVHHDGAMAKRLHGVSKDIAARRLYNILNELGAVAFDPFPFLCAADALVGHAVRAEPVCTDAGLDVAEPSA